MSDKLKLNLPSTSFLLNPKAGWEDSIQKLWLDRQVYEQNLKLRASGPRFLLHDGPPYLSSPKIHIGTSLNKILKDIVTKYKAMNGFYSPFVPGYDSHGLPIETAALKEVKGGRAAVSVLELRGLCRALALKNLAGQEAQFKRLGVWAEWNNPYVTLDKGYEAAQLRVFARLVKNGYVYRGLKPVHWCTNCETALALAEVEQHPFSCEQSVHVRFDVAPDTARALPDFVAAGERVSFVAWTTTPWSLPGNQAVAVNADLDYDFVKTADHGVLVVASALRDALLQTLALECLQLLGTVKGSALEQVETLHPLFDRKSAVVLSDHVKSSMGTGVVHVGPGVSTDDFKVASAYDLPVTCHLDGRGVLTQDSGEFAGLRHFQADAPIVERLREKGKLLHVAKWSTPEHPHCWRCKKPLVERATDQWFASVEGFRQKALDAIETVEWLPASGKNRIREMVASRGDWCISRQRVWGVPIPAFHCNDCGEHLMTADSVERVAQVFDREGSDSWWQHDAEKFLGSDCACHKCGNKSFAKGTDTMDVWFDSGSSFASVVGNRPELGGAPSEMYLEGSDQHRGWFQSSLLLSVGTTGVAPYKTVLTHGFVVDQKMRKMSKSDGNVVDPDDVIKKYGADVLRLWVASVDYTNDTPIGDQLLRQLAEVHQKLRNTSRYLLNNLYDFDPAVDRVPLAELQKVDAYVLHRLHALVERVRHDFDHYEFHKFYQLLQNFCVVDLSSFYFDVVKDRLYSHGAKSQSRRAAQTVLEHVLQTLVRLLAPVTPHLAEDVWQNMPDAVKRAGQAPESVLLAKFPDDTAQFRNDELDALFAEVKAVRSVFNKALELARGEKKVRKTQESQAVLSFDSEELAAKVRVLGEELTGLLLTSQSSVVPAGTSLGEKEVLAQVSEGGVHAFVLRADGAKCQRCWNFRLELSTHAEHGDLCHPCAEVVGGALTASPIEAST